MWKLTIKQGSSARSAQLSPLALLSERWSPRPGAKPPSACRRCSSRSRSSLACTSNRQGEDVELSWSSTSVPRARPCISVDRRSSSTIVPNVVMSAPHQNSTHGRRVAYPCRAPSMADQFDTLRVIDRPERSIDQIGHRHGTTTAKVTSPVSERKKGGLKIRKQAHAKLASAKLPPSILS